MNCTTQAPPKRYSVDEIVCGKKALEAVRAYFDDPDVRRRFEAWKAAKNA